jgi:hypothetical protein
VSTVVVLKGGGMWAGVVAEKLGTMPGKGATPYSLYVYGKKTATHAWMKAVSLSAD